MSEIVDLANNMVKTMYQMLNICINASEFEKLIKLCNSSLRLTLGHWKQTHNQGEKNNILTTITHMKGIREKGRRKLGNPSNKQSDRIYWEDVETAFRKRMRTGCITNITHLDAMSFLNDSCTMFVRRIKKLLVRHQFAKIWTIFCGEFVKASATSESVIDFKYITTKTEVLSLDDNVQEWYNKFVRDTILTQLEEFQERDSGWALSAVVNITFNINKYTPQVGSTYIELPQEIKRKKACINVKNHDDACFAWAVTSALHPAERDSDRTSSYPNYARVLDVTGINFPISREDIRKFENINKISINVYILQKKKEMFKCVPSRLTKQKESRHVNLLLIQDKYNADDSEEEEDNNHDESDNDGVVRYHYVWIKNLSRLVSSGLSKHNGKKYICDRCLQYFYSAKKLQRHEEICQQRNDYKVSFPEEKILKFKNHVNKEKVPFIIYADFECLLKPVDVKTSSSTTKYQEHEAYSVGFYYHCDFDDSSSYYDSYRGEGSDKWFADKLKEIAESVHAKYESPIAMKPLTSSQVRDFKTAPDCWICKKPLFNGKSKRVRDHNHYTGDYRGAAHDVCNLNYHESTEILVIFHNLSGYDAHILIRDISRNIDGYTRVLPCNMEKYIAIIKAVRGTRVTFKFLDSLRFLNSSLDKLASYLVDTPIVRRQFKNASAAQHKLLQRKGVFPYDYITCFSKLSETKLPNKEQFYSKLNDEHISDDDYQHAVNIWTSFDIKTLGEFSDLYLKTDVLLLADIFENFRSTSLSYYGLDPAHYYTAPALTWDAMLMHTGVEIEMIQDVDMLMFFENGIRGGLSQCSKRYARANNRYMESYDAASPESYLIYYDINSMYAWAMSQRLPYGGLKWLENASNFNFNIPADSDFGYVLEVDLEYPESIHDRQADLPMASTSMSPPNSKEKKLLATLTKKKKYVIHYMNLKQYVSEGITVEKIHRVMEFKQSSWLEPYIKLNADLRRNAKNDFEKELFKLMNNAIFGKTMENVRNRRIIKLATKWGGRYGAASYIAKPNFHKSSIFGENFVGIELLKNEVVFSKPIYVGMAILDISKTILYDFHYNYMKKKYGAKCSLCYTDTDSLIYYVKTEDIYSDMKDNIHLFDTSEYEIGNPYGMPQVNKKVVGLMKDENKGKIMTEFIGLRAKMYACNVADKQQIKKAKGTKRSVVESRISIEDYKECLFSLTEKIFPQNSIVSEKHTLYSINTHKISLSANDNKRHICEDYITTLPWGHYKLMNDD